MAVTKYFASMASGQCGWDVLYERREDAAAAVTRAEAQGIVATVESIEVAAHVDHLYRNVADANDATYLYDR